MGVPRTNIVQRFWDKVDLAADDECWLWAGATKAGGYGDFVLHDTHERGRFKVMAHRMSLLLNGISIRDQVVHHTCGVKLCVNPRHLRVMEASEHYDEHRIWTRESVIEVMQGFVSEHGVFPAATDFNPSHARKLGHEARVRRFYENRWPHVNTVQSLFGSWNEALRAAGCEHTSLGRRKLRFALGSSAV